MCNALISVIIPVYKVERYLENCVDSVRQQTYTNLEIILVDDGSPDRCPALCDEFAKQDERIKVIHKENGGLSDARNVGLDNANGDYVTFVDSDDLILPNMIEILLSLCEENGAEMSMCQLVKCGELDTLDTLDTLSTQKNPTKIQSYTGPEKMKAYLADEIIEPTTWKKMYSKRLFAHLRFPKGKIHEDTFTTYLLVDMANKIVVTSDIGYIYRQNSQGIMNSGFSPNRFHAVEAKLQQLGFIEKNYPQLRKYARAEVIYSCNFCLQEMVQADCYHSDYDKEIQQLYRKYLFSYLFATKVSLNGKAVAVLAFFNIKFARRMLSIFLSKGETV